MNNLYDIKLIEKESALSAEELLTMFNRNISKNAEILDYIGKNNQRTGPFPLEQLLANGQYRKALEVGRKSVESDANLLMLRMYALAREKALGDRLFEYPVTGTSADILPTDGRNSLSLCPADSLYRFLGARPATSMAPIRYLELLLASRPSESVVNYYLCGLLIDRQLDRFAREVGKYFTLDDHLPKHYREALVLYAHSTSHPVVLYHHAVTEEDWRNLQELERQYSLESERKGKVEEQYRGTYWYYYEYER